MQKLIVSKHSIASGGHHRVQAGSIVLMLECKHAVLGTQSQHGESKRMSCSLCAAQHIGEAGATIVALQAQLDELRRRFAKPTRQQSGLPRQSRIELRTKALSMLRERTYTAPQLAEALGTSNAVMGKVLDHMMRHGLCVRVGQADGDRTRNVWGLPGTQLRLGGES